jgi:hypothetical protein
MPARSRIRPALCAALALSLSCCAGTSTPSRFSTDDGGDLMSHVDRDATPEAFGVCHGHNCHFHDTVRLTAAQWQEIRALFAPAPASPAEERARIGKAVALVETAVGELLGTKADRPRAPAIAVDPTQLDCVDEATNTSTVLHMLGNAGLLRWHAVGEPAVRGSPFLLSIHFTAVVTEKGTGAPYAIDSWFHATGVLPEIVPLARWSDGYDPEKN